MFQHYMNIFLIAEYYNESIEGFIAITSKIHLYIDSISMIKKLTLINNYLTANLRCTMDSKWGIIWAFHQLMNQIKKWMILEWLGSHQDDNLTIDITTLPTGTQLNIQADVLITKGLQRLLSENQKYYSTHYWQSKPITTCI